jgi:hypothetical protein
MQVIRETANVFIFDPKVAEYFNEYLPKCYQDDQNDQISPEKKAQNHIIALGAFYFLAQATENKTYYSAIEKILENEQVSLSHFTRTMMQIILREIEKQGHNVSSLKLKLNYCLNIFPAAQLNDPGTHNKEMASPVSKRSLDENYLIEKILETHGEKAARLFNTFLSKRSAEQKNNPSITEAIIKYVAKPTDKQAILNELGLSKTQLESALVRLRLSNPELSQYIPKSIRSRKSKTF